jgi:hypothetical protein
MPVWKKTISGCERLARFHVLKASRRRALSLFLQHTVSQNCA